MIYLLIGLGLVAAAFGAGWWLRHRRHLPAGQEPEPRSSDNLALLRKIDRMILSNLSLDYIAQEIVNQLPSGTKLLGGTLRAIESGTGALKALGVTDSLRAAGNELSLNGLQGSILSPAQLQRHASLTAQAIDERRVVSGEQLCDFECPPLTLEQAKRIQDSLQIKGIFAYPITAADRVSGAMTFYFDRPLNHISRKDHEMMQAVTDVIGIAMENSRLINQTEDINKKLAEANTQLHRLDQTKDEFITIASHQLRSPLTAIKGYLSMLLDRDFGAVSKRQEPIFQQIMESTNEVINIINDMLSVSRINAQKFELTRVPIHLEDVIGDVLSELKPLASKKALRVALKVPKQPLGSLSFDPLRIRQVLVNFIDNAIKYTPRGYIDVELKQDGDDVVFTVSDTGIGIPKRELGRMFTKFYRAANARQLVTSGSGLGLFVARQVIEAHQGTCIMESREGRGSTFGFRIPLKVLQSGKADLPPDKVVATGVRS